jgi:hypothetical protein
MSNPLPGLLQLHVLTKRGHHVTQVLPLCTTESQVTGTTQQHPYQIHDTVYLKVSPAASVNPTATTTGACTCAEPLPPH